MRCAVRKYLSNPGGHEQHEISDEAVQ